MKPQPVLNSSIFNGQIRHRRYAPKQNSFNYHLYMLALDVDEVLNQKLPQGIFGYSWYNPIRFVEKDYLKGEPGSLKQRIQNKVKKLGGQWQEGRVTMLVQARCFGLYFSPANFYFCYNDSDSCQYMLAEVSNTPWNQRHYYLIDMKNQGYTDKEFHVSPFMDLDMKYHWRIKAPEKNSNQLLVHIENITVNNNQEKAKLFDATLALTKQPFTFKMQCKVWSTLPVMTFKIVATIYYQALKLFIKKVPFVSYQSSKTKSASINSIK